MRRQVSGGVERVMKVIYSTLREHLPPHVNVAQASAYFQPERKEQLPLVAYWWRTRSATWEVRPDYPILVEVVPSNFTFPPKVQGRHQGDLSSVLVDFVNDFQANKVRRGDIVRNLTKNTRGTVVQILSPNAVETSILFEPDDEYDIHWPVDVMKHYPANREATIELSIFADPQAPYGQTKTLDEVEHLLNTVVWTWLRRNLQRELVEVVEFERVASMTGEVIPGLGVASWYDRAVFELQLYIADTLKIRVPTIEEVPIVIDIEEQPWEGNVEELPDEPWPIGYVGGKLIDP